MRTWIAILFGLVACNAGTDSDAADTDPVDTDVEDTDIVDTDVVDTDVEDTDVEIAEVQFDYVLLYNDNGIPAAANACDHTNVQVTEVRLWVGNDANENGVLDDNEGVFADVTCNQADADQSGILDANELGHATLQVPPGTYNIFAVEFLDENDYAWLWEPFDANTAASRFSYAADLELTAQTPTDLPFLGDQYQLDGELQAFFGF